MDENQPQQQQKERPTTIAEMRRLSAKSDFWRPDSIPMKLRITGQPTLGSNKWGRPQFYAPATLEDGRSVKLALSRRAVAELIKLIDEHGIDERNLTTVDFRVSRTGRGLDTGYVWELNDPEIDSVSGGKVGPAKTSPSEPLPEPTSEPLPEPTSRV